MKKTARLGNGSSAFDGLRHTHAHHTKPGSKYAKTRTLSIKHMDRTEVRSSIIAIRNRNNQYLTYYDEGWKCDFFPNRATASPETNEARLAEYLQHNFGLPENTCSLELVAEGSEAKPSTEHGNELRYYEYKLYRAVVKTMPEGWDAAEFRTQGKRCKWLTLDEMMANPRTNGINHYVIALVRDHA